MPIISPYANAPTLPDGETVDVRELVIGKWIELEIGPGRGMFLQERAMSAIDAGLVGLEIRRKWAALVDSRLKAQGLGGRARVFAEDALHALKRLGPDASVRRVFLLFPDPWWKKKHQKRLVMGDVFLEQIARLLEPNGELFVQTDVEERGSLRRGDHAERQVRSRGRGARFVTLDGSSVRRAHQPRKACDRGWLARVPDALQEALVGGSLERELAATGAVLRDVHGL